MSKFTSSHLLQYLQLPQNVIFVVEGQGQSVISIRVSVAVIVFTSNVFFDHRPLLFLHGSLQLQHFVESYVASALAPPLDLRRDPPGCPAAPQ